MEKNPEGEIHEDLGLLSYDEAREIYVLREFHVEGYMNQYVVESWDLESRIFDHGHRGNREYFSWLASTYDI